MHNFVHLNLAIALFVGYLTFAVGVELAKDNEVESGLHPRPSIFPLSKHHTPLTSMIFDHSKAFACGEDPVNEAVLDLQRRTFSLCTCR